MSRFNNHGRGAWGVHRPDTFPNGSSRRNGVGGRCDYAVFSDHQCDSIGGKLDQLLERLDKFGSWREDTDRWFENLGQNRHRRLDHRARYDDDDSDGDDARRRRNWEQGSRSRNPSDGPRDRRVDDRDRGENRGRPTSCWDPPVGRQTRNQTGGFDNLQFNRSTSCWEPPPRRACRASRGYSTYDQPHHGYQAYDRQHPTSCPLKFNDRISEFAPIGDGESESIHYPYHYWESDEYEEDVDMSSKRGFLANELAYPRDIVKGKGQGKGSVAATKSGFHLGQPEHCTPPHFDDSCRPLRLNLPSSPPTVSVVPPSPPQYSSSCLCMTDHIRSTSTLPAAAAVSSLNLPRAATFVTKQPHQDYQPPTKLPRSDRQPQQLSPPPPSELLPYSAPGPSQPLHPLPETDPSLASNLLPQAAVPSSRSKERQTNLQNVDEYGLINKVVPCSHDVAGEKNIVEDKWKENEMGPKGLVGSKDEEDNDIFRMINVIILRAFDPGIHVSFSKRKYGFFAMPLGNSDLQESESELPLEGVIKCLFAAGETFHIELHMPATHVVFNTVQEFNGDLNVTDITSMNIRLPSLDTDARLIPPRNDTPCLSILRGVDKLFVLAWNFARHIRSLWLISSGGDRVIHSAIRYVFDPGGDA